MPRSPTQDRSRARVERIFGAAAQLLAETGAERITVRTLAARSGVSVGTIYQFFEDVDAVRAAVAERTRGELQKVLATELTLELARASPGTFFSRLIDVIGAVQRRHPHIGCLVQIDRSDEFRGAFALELREYIAGHIRDTFAGAYPKMDNRDLKRKLEVILAALLGALDAMPSRNDPERGAHLHQTKTLISLCANAAFAPKEQSGPVSKRRKARQEPLIVRTDEGIE
jgi:AcrR family transcriptional regulator